jgi:hypothetical protein
VWGEAVSGVAGATRFFSVQLSPDLRPGLMNGVASRLFLLFGSVRHDEYFSEAFGIRTMIPVCETS